MKLATTVLVILLFAVALQVAHYYPLMPDRMASHFGGSGQPDGWSSKPGFFVFYLVILAVTIASLDGVALLIPRFPNSLINLPNKEYWLAPERRAATMEAMQAQLFWFGNVTLGLLIVVMELVFRANLAAQARLGGVFLWVVLGFLAYTVVWAVAFIGRFYRVP